MEHGEISSGSKDKDVLEINIDDEEIARISHFCRSAEMDLHSQKYDVLCL